MGLARFKFLSLSLSLSISLSFSFSLVLSFFLRINHCFFSKDEGGQQQQQSQSRSMRASERPPFRIKSYRVPLLSPLFSFFSAAEGPARITVVPPPRPSCGRIAGESPAKKGDGGASTGGGGDRGGAEEAEAEAEAEAEEAEETPTRSNTAPPPSGLCHPGSPLPISFSSPSGLHLEL